MSQIRRKSTWPDPGVEGLRTRRQAASTAPTNAKPQPKPSAPLNEVQNTKLPSDNTGKSSKGNKAKTKTPGAHETGATRTLPPKTVTPTPGTPAHPLPPKGQNKHDSAGETDMHKTVSGAGDPAAKQTKASDTDNKTDGSASDTDNKTDTSASDTDKKTDTSASGTNKKTNASASDTNKKTNASASDTNKKTNASASDTNKKT
ncbi:hypothetical protein EXIGLDRAFT_705096, partial [Exidia glandulosa HHB12029]